MPSLERAAAARAFAEAVAAQDWDRAEALNRDLAGPLTDATREHQAILHMQQERWQEAADAWNAIASKNDQAILRHTLCRNLASLKSHRPTVYRTIVDADVAEAYRIHTFADGQQTIAAADATGKLTYFSRNPATDIASALTQLKPHCDQGNCIALLSVGDGHVLKALAALPQTLMLGMQQPVVLLEPDPRLLLATLLIQDFTGPAGPIEQQRFLWYVGPQWLDAFRIDALTELYFPFPQVNVKAGIAGAGIERSLVRVIAELQKVDAKADTDLKAHYQPLTKDDFARALTGQSGRPPRVLLLTTLFSTVLQYSTRDAAEAFRALGWSTLVAIEPAPHLRLTRSAIRRMLADFKPDLVFQIDHNRFEHGNLFPANLPFVDWIQDLLPNLMTPAAGRQIGPNDFVLAPSLQRWVDQFAYPARQCLEFRKLTRVPRRPTSWASESEKVVYVSNWSQTPEQMRSALIAEAQGPAKEVMAQCAERMIQVYAAGGALPAPGDVRRLLVQTLADLELAADERLLRSTTSRLFDRMNNLLFRQQGLQWAAQACRAAGLQLRIFGNDWEKHPTFAPYAAGPIGYGEALEHLTRSAGVNLILEPFMCTAHQRPIDALVAGGFCLVRDHPTNHTTDAWIDLLARAPDSLQSDLAIRDSLNADDQVAYDTIRAVCDALDAAPGDIDHAATVRRLQAAGFLPQHGPMVPLLDQVLFSTSETLADKLLRFSRDAELRSEIARVQRRTITERYSYTAGMERMTRFIVQRLCEPTTFHAKAA